MNLSISELPYLESTNNLLSNLSELGNLCGLESANGDHENGRWSIITAAPFKTICKNAMGIDDWKEVESLMNILPHVESDLPFTGGVIGHVNYSASSEESPKSVFYNLYTWAFILDHLTKKTHLIYWNELSTISQSELKDRYNSDICSSHCFLMTSSFKPLWSRNTYNKKIHTIHNYILSGDAYQINLTQKFSGEYQGYPLEAYKRLKSQSNSPFLSYFESKDRILASASPEQFIECKGGIVSTKPIKGTIPRSHNKDVDLNNMQSLQNSSKDKAENLMITDLLRNDLAKNCTNIKVPKLFSIESFETVHHLVTTITAEKPKQISAFKVFQDAFPGGSITGTPKKRAMEIISELEDFSRDLYCGCSFLYSSNGKFNSNILIRSFVFENNKVHCWAGGAITIDSTAEGEYQESLDKISRLMSTLEN